ncbi:MAG: hypothetical protein HYX52_09240 [Chloroflexi bacterium]|nr:hypothetical protein [Chloroflexota bacterium]
MAIAAVPRIPLTISRATVHVPMGVSLAAVGASASDVLASLQHLPFLEGAAFTLTVVAALGLATSLLHAAHGRWIGIAALVFALSAALRLAGVQDAAMANVIALMAMGIGGAFRDHPSRETALGPVPGPSRLDELSRAA